MTARIVVYCTKALDRWNSLDVLKQLKAADLRAIAKEFDVPWELIESGIENLRIDGENALSDGRAFALLYGTEPIYRIDMKRDAAPEYVEEMIEEGLEQIEDEDDAASTFIREHMENVVEIACVQHGSNVGMEMAPVLASEIARLAASQGDGIIEGADGSWWSLDEKQDYRHLIN